VPPDFNPSFAAPHWGWWIVLYFFVGGVTGGIYFAAAWLDLFGDRNDRSAVRIGHLLAFPLIIVSAIFLIVDLGQPLRFWHMVFQSERVPLPMVKLYSPMSLGSLILTVFGAASFLSFVGALLGRDRWFHSHGNPIGKLLSIVGAVGGLALASYTGMLLNTTNEPVWGNSPLISALFLFSGASTGIAVLLLLARRVSHTTYEKLSEADGYMMLFELITLVLFLATLGALWPDLFRQFILGTPTAILFAIVLVIGLLLPLVLHWRPGLAGGMRSAATLSAVLVLIGGFILRWAVLAAPQGSWL
jgi:formate-dependent nitrite reductase membrane component NrfD